MGEPIGKMRSALSHWQCVVLWLTLILVTIPAAFGAHTKAELFLPLQQTRAGSQFAAGVRLSMDPGWHTYWRNPGDSGGATKIEWALPEGFSAGEINWPAPVRYVEEDLVTFVYYKDITLLIPITIGPNVAPGIYDIRAKVRWLECEKVCVQASQDVSAKIQIGANSVASTSTELLSQAQSKLPLVATLSQPSARWIDAPTGEVRRLQLEWSADASVTKADFWAYESTNAMWRLTNVFSRLGSDRARLLLYAEKMENQWPKMLSGLITIGTPAELNLKIEDGRSIEPSTSPVLTNSASIMVRQSTPRSIWNVLLGAFLGGLILNIMPCVLPVISLKILGFVQQSGNAPGRVRQLGLLYALGVIFSFVLLAGMVIGLKTAGQAVSWGIQFGNAQFLVVLTTLVTLIALNLFGVFEVTAGHAMSAAGELANREGASGAFFNGVLAVVLATPCTAPFLGSAVGFALDPAQSSFTIILTFVTVGVGLALPYVLLSWNPAWMKILPRPGIWMERFKVSMGFPMLATAIWLFWIAGKHFGDEIIWLGMFLVLLSAAMWVFGQFVQRNAPRKGLSWAVILLLLGFGYLYALERELNWRRRPADASLSPVATSVSKGLTSTNTSVVASASGKIAWQPWSPLAIEKARAEGKIVFVEFTADWCLLCKANQKRGIEITEVKTKLEKLGVVTMLGDYTKTPADMTEELLRWGRGAVPLVLVYPKDRTKTAEVLPEWLNAEIVLAALERANQ